ncbi:MAG: prepilin-type N-terminal cleavage/methylation domain-containing protein [Nitrospirae bacterium]|nr:prepilin-type N-terminal cleavage/methylation domain-containing protein [Nitrospirota bacterium]
MTNRVTGCPRLAARGSRASGFTLIEVFFALAILATTLFAYMQMTNDNVRKVRHARENYLIGLLLQMKMADVLAEKFPDQGTRSGDFADEGYPDYAWEATVTQAMLGEISFRDLREVTVRVMWGEGEPKTEISMVAYVLDRKFP